MGIFARCNDSWFPNDLYTDLCVAEFMDRFGGPFQNSISTIVNGIIFSNPIIDKLLLSMIGVDQTIS